MTHCEAFKSCKGFIKYVLLPFRTRLKNILCRVPQIAYAEKMAQQSNCFVLDVSDDDPATTHGCTSVMLNLLNYVPKISTCGEVGMKTEVFGDQGLVEKSRKATYSRTEEKAGQRLSSLVSLPSDWHAMKVQQSIIFSRARGTKIIS